MDLLGFREYRPTRGLFQISDALVDVGVDGVIRLRKIARVEHRLPEMFRIVVADGAREDREQILDAELRWLHQLGVIQSRVQATGVNQAPAVTKSIRVVTFDVESLVGIVLKDRYGVVVSFDKQIDRLRTQLCRKKTIEENRPAATLSVADFSGEDGFRSGISAAVLLEILVAERFTKPVAERFSGAGQYKIAGRIRGFRYSAKSPSLFVDDSFAAHDHDVLLKVVQIFHPLDEPFNIQRHLGNKDDVGLPVSAAERNVPGSPAHDLDNRDTAMALRSRPHAIDTLSRDHNRCRVTGRSVVHDLIEIEHDVRIRPAITIPVQRERIGHAHPLVRFAGIVETKVIVDGLRRKYRGKP